MKHIVSIIVPLAVVCLLADIMSTENPLAAQGNGMECRSCHSRFPLRNGHSPRMYSGIASALVLSGLFFAIGWHFLQYLWLGGLCLTCGGGAIAAIGAAWTRTIDCCSAQVGRTTVKLPRNCGVSIREKIGVGALGILRRYREAPIALFESAKSFDVFVVRC